MAFELQFLVRIRAGNRVGSIISHFAFFLKLFRSLCIIDCFFDHDNRFITECVKLHNIQSGFDG